MANLIWYMCAFLAEAMRAEDMKVLEEINLAMEVPSASLDHIFKTLDKNHLYKIFFQNFIHTCVRTHVLYICVCVYIYTYICTNIYHFHASLLNPSLMAESIFIFSGHYRCLHM